MTSEKIVEKLNEVLDGIQHVRGLSENADGYAAKTYRAATDGSSPALVASYASDAREFARRASEKLDEAEALARELRRSLRKVVG